MIKKITYPASWNRIPISLITLAIGTLGFSGQGKAAATNLTAAAWTVDGSAATATNAAAGNNLTNTTNANVTSVTISGTGYLANSAGRAIEVFSGSIANIAVTGSGNSNTAISATGGSAIYDNSSLSNVGMAITNSGTTASTITSTNDWTVWFNRTTGTGNFSYTQGNTAGTESGNATTTGTNNVFAVNVQTSDVSFNNFNGTISASGAMTLSNFGVIGVTTSGAGGDISVVNGSSGGTGIISLTNSNSTSSAIYLRALNSGTISLTNTSGTISSYASSASGVGTIQFHQDNTGTGTITLNNSGTIANYRSTTGGNAIYFQDSGGTVALTNNSGGSITTAGAGVAAIKVNGVHAGTITNSGTITGAGTTGAGGTAIAIDNSANTTQTTINLQSGSITNGALKLGTGVVSQDIVNLNGGTLNGDIVASGASKGTVNVTANTSTNGNIGTAAGNALNSLAVTGGVLTLNNNVKATTTSNSATLAISSGNTSTITGNYTQAAGGTFQTGLTSNTGFGKLVVSGTATLQSNAKIDVNVVGTPSLTLGTTLASVISAGTLSSDGTFAVTDNSALFNFTAAKNGNAVDLTIAKGTTAASATTGSGNTAASGAAAVFDTLIGSSGLTAEMNSVITTLGQLSTSQQLSDAISQTLPLQTGGMSQSIRNSLRGSNRIIQARQEGQLGRSSGDEFFGDQHAWFKPFGSWTGQDDRNGVSGFDANTYGMVFGVDAEISDSKRLGVAFSYARSNIDSNSNVAKQTADVNSYQLALYGSHNFSDVTDINFQFDIGKHDNEGLRDITFAGTRAKSDYSSWSAHLGAGLAHTYTLSDKTTLTPSVRADYTRIRDESYNETGNAGALNLRVNSNTTEELVLGVDGKLAHALTDQATFTANLGFGYDVINEQASLTSAFAGAPSVSFTTKGLDPSPWLMRGGLGIVSKATETVEISARYDIEARKDFDNQTASMKVRWAF
ncbi:MAG: autotransporter domain-containing protein [Methylotenera sp.]|nr:autotransporter domain-containing protein [Methylotenera sp.]